MRWLLIALHGVLGLGALAAGQAFVRDPTGRTLSMQVDWLRGSPFHDYRFPGLFLAVVIGGANGLTTLLLLRRHRFGPMASFLTGLLLVVWVSIQTVIVGVRHWSQAIWWVMFPLVALLGGVQLRRSRRIEPR